MVFIAKTLSAVGRTGVVAMNALWRKSAMFFWHYALKLRWRSADTAIERETGHERIVLLLCQARDVTHPRSVQKQRFHEQSAESFRRLAAGVAHDFNNILQAIGSALELILEDAAATGQNGEFARTALSAAQRGSQLTQNLLAYAYQRELTPGPIDLRQWLPKIAPTMEDAIGRSNRLVLIFAGPPAIACVDASALHTALLNLALNAGRAMAEGGLLRIETDSGCDPDSNTPCVRIKICETRMGMDAATLDGCPETHFTARDVSGAGLALSMAEAFAIQSGGSLRLSNRLGEGTTALLTLPAHLDADRFLTGEKRAFERDNRVPAAIGT